MATFNAVIPVALPGKKRRAAFGDLTNNDGFGNKKKCLKRDDKHCATKKKVARVQSTANRKFNPQPTVTDIILPPVLECDTQRSTDVIKNVMPIVSLDTSSCVLVEIHPSDLSATSDNETASSITANDTVPSPAVVLVDIQEKLLEETPAKELFDRFGWIDVDEENKDYPIYVSEYVNDIFQYYKQREPELSCVKRAILVDWLVDVQQNFELTHETLYLTVKMVDLFLDRHPAVEKDRIQLLGTAALSVACKFEEQSAPVLTDYVYICDDAYTAEEILEMEASMLTTLGFDIGIPLSYTFLRRYAQCARVSIPTLTLARYILESSLLDYVYVKCSGSRVAAACLLLAMKMIKEGSWDETVVHYTGYVSTDLKDLVRQLNEMVSTPLNKTVETIHKKYSHRGDTVLHGIIN